MRLYFETPAGRRLAIDTARQEYCTGADIAGKHRFIWLDSEKDLSIIESEIEFCGWNYCPAWTIERPADVGAAITDPFYRPPRARDTRKTETGAAARTADGETALKKYVLCELAEPLNGYTHNLQIWTSTDGGQNFYYCGNGFYFRSGAEAIAYREYLEGGAADPAQEGGA